MRHAQRPARSNLKSRTTSVLPMPSKRHRFLLRTLAKTSKRMRRRLPEVRLLQPLCGEHMGRGKRPQRRMQAAAPLLTWFRVRRFQALRLLQNTDRTLPGLAAAFVSASVLLPNPIPTSASLSPRSQPSARLFPRSASARAPIRRANSSAQRLRERLTSFFQAQACTGACWTRAFATSQA